MQDEIRWQKRKTCLCITLTPVADPEGMHPPISIIFCSCQIIRQERIDKIYRSTFFALSDRTSIGGRARAWDEGSAVLIYTSTYHNRCLSMSPVCSTAHFRWECWRTSHLVCWHRETSSIDLWPVGRSTRTRQTRVGRRYGRILCRRSCCAGQGPYVPLSVRVLSRRTDTSDQWPVHHAIKSLKEYGQGWHYSA